MNMLSKYICLCHCHCLCPCICICLFYGQVMSPHHSNVSKVTSLWDRSFKVLSKCICLCHCLCICICLCHCLFLGQVMSSHHSDQMSQRSQVSGIAPPPLPSILEMSIRLRPRDISRASGMDFPIPPTF